MPSTIDFEYIGNSSCKMEHLIGTSDKSQLNFELNLRGYKNTTQFKGDAPWIYPTTK